MCFYQLCSGDDFFQLCWGQQNKAIVMLSVRVVFILHDTEHPFLPVPYLGVLPSLHKSNSLSEIIKENKAILVFLHYSYLEYGETERTESRLDIHIKYLYPLVEPNFTAED